MKTVSLIAAGTGALPCTAMQAMFVLYALLGGAAALVYRDLPVALGATTQQTTAPLEKSKKTVYTLAALFSLDAFGGNFSDDYWNFNKLIEVNRRNPVLLPSVDILDALTAECPPPSAIFKRLFSDWLRASAIQIFLKQFRSILDQSNGCAVQEITAARYTITGVPSHRLLAHRFEIKIHALESDPVVRDLGLEGTTAGGVFQKDVIGGFRVETGFCLGGGLVVYS